MTISLGMFEVEVDIVFCTSDKLIARKSSLGIVYALRGGLEMNIFPGLSRRQLYLKCSFPHTLL